MSEAMREAFQALEQLPSHVIVPMGNEVEFADAIDAIKAGLDEALREYVGAQQAPAPGMIPVCEQLPEMGTPVIGFSPDWIDADFNERGLRECFTYGDPANPSWHSARWLDEQDCYMTGEDAPTHWFPMGSHSGAQPGVVAIKHLLEQARRVRNFSNKDDVFEAVPVSVIRAEKAPGEATTKSTPQPAQALPERDPALFTEQQGLFHKFDVRRVDGSDQPGGKHHGCRYYVIDVDHDPHAAAALGAYANACQSTSPALARDLREKWGAAPQPAQVPKGWMLFPVEAWRFLAGESSLAGVHFGETVNDDKTGRKKPFWWRSHIRHMLTAAPSPDRIAEGGEAVPLAFGSGDYTVEVGRYVDQQAVFIAPARPRGVPGELAPPTTGADRYRLVPGERVMTFPTEAQAFAVAEAIAGRKINRVGGHPVPPSVAVTDDTDDTVYRIGDLGNQIHNLGCSQQNNEELADCLAELAHQAWNLQGELVRERKSAPSDTPSVPENEVTFSAAEIEFMRGILLAPGCKHPAPAFDYSLPDQPGLWPRLEEMDLIECVGSYKWRPTEKLKMWLMVDGKVARLRTAGDEGGVSHEY